MLRNCRRARGVARLGRALPRRRAGRGVGTRARRAWLLDWGGGLVWAAVPESGDVGAEAVRRAIRGQDGGGTGHATLVKASAALRRAIAVFEPQPAPLAALSRRVKEAFDPEHILNPGRMQPIEARGS